jgi:hypothetical protein
MFTIFFSNLENCDQFGILCLYFGRLSGKIMPGASNRSVQQQKEKLWACRYIAESQLHINQTKAVREVVLLTTSN